MPPERLIKALLLQSIYSIRSDAQLVERIDHDLLFRWFLDLRIDEAVFDATVFCHNRKRLQEHALVGAFFESTVRRAIAAGLISADHFSVNGSLIEAYASIKSFQPRDRTEDDEQDNNGFKSRNAEVDFHGQKRCNDTDASTTDPDAKLVRKGDGQPALFEPRVACDCPEPPRAGAGGGGQQSAGQQRAQGRLVADRPDQEAIQDQAQNRWGRQRVRQGPLLRGLERRKIRPHVAVKDGKIGGDTARYRRQNQANIAARHRMRRRTKGVGGTRSASVVARRSRNGSVGPRRSAACIAPG